MHFRSYITLFSFFAGLIAPVALTADAGAKGNWKSKAISLMKSKPLVTVDRGKSKSKVRLVQIRKGQLIFELDSQGGRASMPISQLGDVLMQIDSPKDYSKLLGEANSEGLSESSLDVLRKTAYPMVRFLRIPQANCDFHLSVQGLLQGLIVRDHLDEAMHMLKFIDIARAGPEIEEQSALLAQALWEQKRHDDVIKLMKIIPVEQVNLSNVPLVLKVANDLREKQSFKQAYDIYQRLAKNPALEDEEALYWSYYCGINLGHFEDDHGFYDEVIRIEPGDRLYPLQQLVVGNYYMQRMEHDKGMKAIGEGVAYATPMQPWTAELMYRSGKAYEVLEQPAIATAVYKETVRFFPNSRWAESSQEALNN